MDTIKGPGRHSRKQLCQSESPDQHRLGDDTDECGSSPRCQDTYGPLYPVILTA